MKKHLHIVGICGVATSALGIAFHKKGWRVTGSDKGFFPPVSTELEKHGVEFYAGWHPEKMIAGGMPDLVIAGTASGTQNPETKFAEENKLLIKSDAEVRGEYFAKKNSIVCAGTWGKTSSTALLSHILIDAGMDPSFVIGGLSLSTDAAHLGDSEWSVIEGDEYKSSPWDTRPKFAHLHTTHLLLTAVSWDHADLYPTEESYFDAFRKLIKEIPASDTAAAATTSGLIVANKDNAKVTELVAPYQEEKRIIWYGKKDADYTYSDIGQTKNGLTFQINHAGKKYAISSPMIGTFQAENITGCFAMASEIGIAPEKIASAIASFKGLRRRLEKRSVSKSESEPDAITIFDDIAHSPEKANAVLQNLRRIYQNKIITIFEPNIGGRRSESAAKYDHAFAAANTVIIPRLTKLKVAENEAGQPMDGAELAQVISKTHADTHYVENDTALIDFIFTNAKKGDVVAFLGSHGFRGMIEETIQKITTHRS